MNEKIRIAVTVNKQVATQIKADLKSLNLPPQTLSNLVDEWLTAFAPAINQMAEKKRKGEQLTFDEVAGTILAGMTKTDS